MNVQTERLENHTLRLTIEIETERLDTAKQKAAQKLSKRYRIPGFRPGKAPYKMVVNYVGEPTILAEAMESMTDEVYRSALTEGAVRAYGPGAVEDIKFDPPTYVFVVPLIPEVKLNNYRDIRGELTIPEITDEQFNEALKQIQQREALVETSTEPAAMGNRLTLGIHSHFEDGEERPAEDAETPADDEGKADEQTVPYKGDEFIHHHDYELHMEENALIPGFAAALVGAKAGDEVEFELTIPDKEEYKDVVGRKVKFEVHVEKVENVTLPELDDEFAARITKDEKEPLTLEQLKARVRENMQKEAKDRAEDEFANKILDDIIAQAEIAFPPDMVAERAEELVQEFDQMLRRQGIALDMYMKATGLTQEKVREIYEPQAIEQVRRTLALGEILVAEQVSILEEEINQRIDEMLETLSEDRREIYTKFYKSSEQRARLLNNMLYERVMERLVLIGKGEAPEVSSEVVVAAAEEPAAESVTENAVASSEETVTNDS